MGRDRGRASASHAKPRSNAGGRRFDTLTAADAKPDTGSLASAVAFRDTAASVTSHRLATGAGLISPDPRVIMPVGTI
jgi:hypothetical protein